MEVQLFIAERANDEVEMEFYDESIKEQKAVCEEAKTLMQEARHELNCLNNAYGHYNTKNRPCHESRSKKKRRIS